MARAKSERHGDGGSSILVARPGLSLAAQILLNLFQWQFNELEVGRRLAVIETARPEPEPVTVNLWQSLTRSLGEPQAAAASELEGQPARVSGTVTRLRVTPGGVPRLLSVSQ